MNMASAKDAAAFSGGKSWMTWVIWAHAIMVIIGVGTVYLKARRDYVQIPDPKVYASVPAFELTSSGSGILRREQLSGLITILSIVHEDCQGPCPLVTERMKEIRAAVRQYPDIRLLTMVAGAEDAEALEDFEQEHGISGRWDLAAAPAATAQNFLRELDIDGIAASGALPHVTQLILIDRANQVRGYYSASDVQDVRRLVKEAEHLLR